ncbi:MAG: hypothetical protein V3V67_02940 [Myxococcota bacterium]
MRALGYALIVLCLLFSAGGVSVGAADAEPSPSLVDETKAPTAEAEEEGGSCEVRQTRPVRTVRIQLPARTPGATKKVFVLNSRGFNYARPGSLPVLPPGDPYGKKWDRP